MYYISYSIWIKKSDNWFEILIKLILALIYNINLENEDINCINKVVHTFNKVSRDFYS